MRRILFLLPILLFGGCSLFDTDNSEPTVDSEGHVLALDLRKGKVLWERYLELPVTGGLNGGEGVLVFGTGKGEVVALREKDGTLLWKTPVSSEVMAVSRVALGTVVARTNDGNLHGIDIGTGGVRWQAGRRTPPLSLRGASTASSWNTTGWSMWPPTRAVWQR